ncbi:MAG: hypothetical protein AB7K04_00690 [Pseudorhodoplanes sp.]
MLRRIVLMLAGIAVANLITAPLHAKTGSASRNAGARAAPKASPPPRWLPNIHPRLRIFPRRMLVVERADARRGANALSQRPDAPLP